MSHGGEYRTLVLAFQKLTLEDRTTEVTQMSGGAKLKQITGLNFTSTALTKKICKWDDMYVGSKNKTMETIVNEINGKALRRERTREN